jgi:hypothetical protein
MLRWIAALVLVHRLDERKMGYLWLTQAAAASRGRWIMFFALNNKKFLGAGGIKLGDDRLEPVEKTV